MTYFHNTCRDIFNYLLKLESYKDGFFELISAYFDIIKTNSWDILYFYCFMWLKKLSSLSDLCEKIADEDVFNTQLFSFLDQVINYELTH